MNIEKMGSIRVTLTVEEMHHTKMVCMSLFIFLFQRFFLILETSKLDPQNILTAQ